MHQHNYACKLARQWFTTPATLPQKAKGYCMGICTYITARKVVLKVSITGIRLLQQCP